MINISKYLQRINYNGSAAADYRTLKELHRLHMKNIPFENLTIHYQGRIELDISYLYKKIVEKKLGGFCYELNGLFFTLLKELGFNADMVSARVRKKEAGYGNEFDHMALIVHLEEDWIADVGFGDSFTEPIKFHLNEEQAERNRIYKIIKHDGEYYRLLRIENEISEDQYIFSAVPRCLSDFKEMCYYHQTSPQSTFTQKRICTLATEDGRVTLSNLNLIITKNGNKKETQLKNETEFREKLLEYFQIDPDEIEKKIN